jgi:hypothetical protein
MCAYTAGVAGAGVVEHPPRVSSNGVVRTEAMMARPTAMPCWHGRSKDVMDAVMARHTSIPPHLGSSKAVAAMGADMASPPRGNSNDLVRMDTVMARQTVKPPPRGRSKDIVEMEVDVASHPRGRNVVGMEAVMARQTSIRPPRSNNDNAAENGGRSNRVTVSLRSSIDTEVSIIDLVNPPCGNKAHNTAWVVMMNMLGDGDGNHKAAWAEMMPIPGHGDGTTKKKSVNDNATQNEDCKADTWTGREDHIRAQGATSSDAISLNICHGTTTPLGSNTSSTILLSAPV